MAITQTTNNIPEDGRSSKLDKVFDRCLETLVVADAKSKRPIEVKIKGLDQAKSEIKALIEEVIGPDTIPSNEEPYAVGQNVLRKVQRQRKDAL